MNAEKKQENNYSLLLMKMHKNILWYYICIYLYSLMRLFLLFGINRIIFIVFIYNFNKNSLK